MNSHQPRETYPAFKKLIKATEKILKAQQSGKFHHLPLYKQVSLFKRYNRCLGTIISMDKPVSKALGLFTVTLFLSIKSQAQCREFVNADSINPLPLQTLPFKIVKPVFVDIDKDADLDCYAFYNNSWDSTEIIFLKNMGSKNVPVFRPDSSKGGFPKETTVNSQYSVEGMTFSDLDGDGDYDCFIGNYGYSRGWVTYFENVGDKNNPSFIQRSRQENPLGFFGGSYGLYFNLADMDADGDYDLATSDLYYNEVYENKGTRNNPEFVHIRSLPSGPDPWGNDLFAHAVMIDWDKNGTLDCIKAHLYNTYNVFYKNVGTIKKPHFRKDADTGPVVPDDFALYSFADLNNDGFPEAFSYTGNYAVTSPVATITAVNRGQTFKLKAHPKGAYTYQWRRNRVKLVNETKDSLVVTVSGNYTVEITGSCGTGISLPFKVKIDAGSIASSGEEDIISGAIKEAAPMLLYPNPFKDECLLKFRESLPGRVLINITDAQGRIVSYFQTAGNAIRLGKELRQGFYFVQVIQNNKVIFRQKIIKQ